MIAAVCYELIPHRRLLHSTAIYDTIPDIDDEAEKEKNIDFLLYVAVGLLLWLSIGGRSSLHVWREYVFQTQAFF